MEPVQDVAHFVSQVMRLRTSRDSVTVYRGHEDNRYLLSPSIFRRKSFLEHEDRLISEMLSSHPEEFSSDRTTLEQLVRMQHYALPTRLLDVTFNPLVALYFASAAASTQNGSNGEVIAISVPRKLIKYFDSDTVSCIANISKLSETHKSDLMDMFFDSIDEFNLSRPGVRLLHFIRQERNQFEARIDPIDLLGPILVKPKMNNKRIIAQSGAFFVFGIASKLVSGKKDEIRISRIPIRADAKVAINTELDRLNVHEKSLFPEIDRTSRYLSQESERLSKILPGDLFD